jgi:hypothetical protein
MNQRTLRSAPLINGTSHRRDMTLNPRQ